MTMRANAVRHALGWAGTAAHMALRCSTCDDLPCAVVCLTAYGFALPAAAARSARGIARNSVRPVACRSSAALTVVAYTRRLTAGVEYRPVTVPGAQRRILWLDEASATRAFGTPLRGTSVSEPPMTSSRGSPALCARWKQRFNGAA